jgi:hypothetical protein
MKNDADVGKPSKAEHSRPPNWDLQPALNAHAFTDLELETIAAGAEEVGRLDHCTPLVEEPDCDASAHISPEQI